MFLGTTTGFEVQTRDILCTLFNRLTALALIKFLDLDSGRLFEVGAYWRLGAY